MSIVILIIIKGTSHGPWAFRGRVHGRVLIDRLPARILDLVM